MTEITIKSKNTKAIKALADLAESFNLEVVQKHGAGKKKILLRKRDQSIKAEDLAGAMKNSTPPDLETIRKKMWRER